MGGSSEMRACAKLQLQHIESSYPCKNNGSPEGGEAEWSRVPTLTGINQPVSLCIHTTNFLPPLARLPTGLVHRTYLIDSGSRLPSLSSSTSQVPLAIQSVGLFVAPLAGAHSVALLKFPRKILAAGKAGIHCDVDNFGFRFVAETSGATVACAGSGDFAGLRKSKVKRIARNVYSP